MFNYGTTNDLYSKCAFFKVGKYNLGTDRSGVQLLIVKWIAWLRMYQILISSLKLSWKVRLDWDLYLSPI
uniref:Uncharacterized protein n=1 Tax=Trichobilharzia regenti TaxID=157069 RepID=A0AA85JEU5_TRIRE|nr:unnamed protein product [Trichobilharzia regenti]